MGKMSERHIRLLRAAVVCVVILTLSSAAHVTGGGTLPHPLLLFALAAFGMLPALFLSRRSLKLPTLLTALGTGQFVLHHALAMLSTSTTCVPGAAHAHHGTTAACLAGPVETAAQLPGSGMPLSMTLGMLAAHAAATLATAVVLTRGEQALYATAAWLRPLFAPLRTAAVVPGRALAAGFSVQLRSVAAPFLSCAPRRGPPAFH